MPRQQTVGDSKDEYDPMAGRLTPYMADGGVVDDEKGDVDASQLPGGALPPSQPVAPPARPMPGMGPEVTPDALQQMLGQYKSGLEKYGPEEQMATRAALTKANAGVLPTLARAGGGFADALMQGVARAGPSNFQQNITAGQNKAMDDTMSTMEKAQAGKMSQQEAQMKLTMNDPGSPLSKLAQNAERDTLKKLGWSDDQINGTSANMIGDATKNGLSYADVQAKLKLESEIHGQTIEMQKAQLEALKARQKAETVQGAAGKLQSRGITERVRDVFSPSPETKALQSQLSGEAATTSVGPYGAETQKDGKTYVWSQATGKYHLKT